MKAQFSQEHLQPNPIQQPHFQLHIAENLNRVVKSPDSHRTSEKPDSQPHMQTGVSSGGSGPGPPVELSPIAQQSIKQLDATQVVLHQLFDIFSGLMDSLPATSYDPATTRANQRMLKGALSISLEVLSHAEFDGKPIFKVSTSQLSSTRSTFTNHSATLAYGRANEFISPRAQQPAPMQRTMNLVNHHIVGKGGILSELQSQADYGPFTSVSVKKTIHEIMFNLQSLQHEVSETIAHMSTNSKSSRTTDVYF